MLTRILFVVNVITVTMFVTTALVTGHVSMFGAIGQAELDPATEYEVGR